MVNIITNVSKYRIAFTFRVKNFKERYGERLLDPEEDDTTIFKNLG